MIPPALFLEFPGGQILLIGPLRIIKDKKQTIGPQLFENGRIVEDMRGRGGIGGRRGIGIAGNVGPLSFGIVRGGTEDERVVERSETGGGRVVGELADRRRDAVGRFRGGVLRGGALEGEPADAAAQQVFEVGGGRGGLQLVLLLLLVLLLFGGGVLAGLLFL